MGGRLRDPLRAGPNWILAVSETQDLDGYVRYTAPEEYEVLSGIVVRFVIDDKE